VNCPVCNASGAYLGLVKIECPNPSCQHFKAVEQSRKSGVGPFPADGLPLPSTLSLKLAGPMKPKLYAIRGCFIQDREQIARQIGHALELQGIKTTEFSAFQLEISNYIKPSTVGPVDRSLGVLILHESPQYPITQMMALDLKVKILDTQLPIIVTTPFEMSHAARLADVITNL
jgi:hypothetical protein